MKNAEKQVNTRVSGNKVDEYSLKADHGSSFSD